MNKQTKGENVNPEFKTIDIKGKPYVQVHERVKYFNENYKNGSIQTSLITEPVSDRIIVKAVVFPDINDINRKFTGYSQAVIGDGYINKTSALENAETSSVGRALGFMGIGIVDSFASADEMNKALDQENAPTPKVEIAKDLPKTEVHENAEIIQGFLESVTIKSGTKNDGTPWGKGELAIDTGDEWPLKVGTFDKKLIEAAEKLVKCEVKVGLVPQKKNPKYKDVVSIEDADPVPV